MLFTIYNRTILRYYKKKYTTADPKAYPLVERSHTIFERVRHVADKRGKRLPELVVVDSPRDPWAKILADFDNDGYTDVAIGGRNGPLVWYKYPQWAKSTITMGGYRTVDGEAGDIDSDGDFDIVMGGLLWYENPLPVGNPEKDPWMEHLIADHMSLWPE